MVDVTAKLAGNLDVDIMLRDLSVDLGVTPERRALCAVSLGMPVNDAFYSVRELHQAVEWVHQGLVEGPKKLAKILATPCDDYQRCVYYILEGRGIVAMLDNLHWLMHLLRHRGRSAAAAARAGTGYVHDEHPYVSTEAGGPLVADHPGFLLGQSWATDRYRGC